jgi:hypothetical protein
MYVMIGSNVKNVASLLVSGVNLVLAFMIVNIQV